MPSYSEVRLGRAAVVVESSVFGECSEHALLKRFKQTVRLRGRRERPEHTATRIVEK